MGLEVLNPDANRGQAIRVFTVTTAAGAGTNLVVPDLGRPYKVLKAFVQFPTTTVTGADATLVVQANDGAATTTLVASTDLDAADGATDPVALTLSSFDVADGEWVEAVVAGGTIAESIVVSLLVAFMPE